jgi:hypothetical protein
MNACEARQCAAPAGRRRGERTLVVPILCLLLWLGGCCSAPSIDLMAYEHLREDPAEAVRYFQLACELGWWREAGSCLLHEDETVGPWELWIGIDMPIRELGNLSLKEIIVGTYYIEPPATLTDASRRAVVWILSHPTPAVIQRYDLILVKRENRWLIDLEKTVDANM